jgi:hypothetical protein
VKSIEMGEGRKVLSSSQLAFLTLRGTNWYAACGCALEAVLDPHCSLLWRAGRMSVDRCDNEKYIFGLPAWHTTPKILVMPE